MTPHVRCLISLLAALTAPRGVRADLTLSTPIPLQPAPSIALSAPQSYSKAQSEGFALEVAAQASSLGLILAHHSLKSKAATETSAPKLQLKISERSGLDRLLDVRNGTLAGTIATVDEIARLGPSQQVVPIALTGYQRGNIQLALRTEIDSLRSAGGRAIITSAHSPAEFFLRWLAWHNGLKTTVITSLDTPMAQDTVSFAYVKTDAEAASFFAQALQRQDQRVAGCVAGSSLAAEAVQATRGQSYLLTSTLNQLVIADILVLNPSLVPPSPKPDSPLIPLLQALFTAQDSLRQAAGLLPEAARQNSSLMIAASAVSTLSGHPHTAESVAESLKTADLADLPTSLAFGRGTLTGGGSWPVLTAATHEIFSQSGPEATPPPSPAAPGLAFSFQTLEALASQAPVAAQIKAWEAAPDLLALAVWKNLDFTFPRNVYTSLELTVGGNSRHFQLLADYLRCAPAAKMEIIGHLDGSEAQRQGPEWAGKYAQAAKDASLQRATTVREVLLKSVNFPADRVSVQGVGWTQPFSDKPQDNRRVEIKILARE